MEYIVQPTGALSLLSQIEADMKYQEKLTAFFMTYSENVP